MRIPSPPPREAIRSRISESMAFHLAPDDIAARLAD